MIKITRSVTLQTDKHSCPATCVLEQYDVGDAAKLGLKVLGIIWLITGVTVFIPLIHFISVPLGILVGPVIALVMFYERKRKLSLTPDNTPCPDCQHPLQFEFDHINKPLSVACTQCHAIVRIMLPSHGS